MPIKFNLDLEELRQEGVPVAHAGRWEKTKKSRPESLRVHRSTEQPENIGDRVNGNVRHSFRRIDQVIPLREKKAPDLESEDEIRTDSDINQTLEEAEAGMKELLE